MGARSASAALARSVVNAACSLGAPRETLLAALGHRWEDLAAYDLRIATRETTALWHAIEQWADDPLISVRVARVIAASVARRYSSTRCARRRRSSSRGSA